MALVYFIGRTLARKGDILARVTGLGGSWVGLVFLACATSMPELITGVATAGVVREPDLALGNIFGSCLFNLTIIAVLDVLRRGMPVLRDVGSSQLLPAILGLGIIGVGVAGVYMGTRGMTGAAPTWGFSGGIIIFYVVSIRLLYGQSRRDRGTPDPATRGGIGPARAFGGFALWSVALIVAALALSFTGDEISEHPFGTFTLGKTIVGTIFLAFATSLPELSVSITAARLGAAEMAVGNVLGSNLFNLAVIPFCEVAALIGGGPPVLLSGSATHILTGGVSMLLTLVVIGGMRLRRRASFGPLGIESVLILIIYLATMVALAIHR
jgi:cation:H+ antiporter